MQPKLRVFVCNALIELVQPELARNMAATCTFLVSQIVSFTVLSIFMKVIVSYARR